MSNPMEALLAASRSHESQLKEQEARAATAKPVDAPAVAEVPNTESMEVLPKFRVKLRDNPALIVNAYDRLEAQFIYMKTCGILGTIHPFEIERVV